MLKSENDCAWNMHVQHVKHARTPVAVPVVWVETCTEASMLSVPLPGESWTVTTAGSVASEDM